MSELEKIKLVNLDKPARQISQMSSTTTNKKHETKRCSCLSCITFKRKATNENAACEELECLNTSNTDSRSKEAHHPTVKLHTVNTDTLMSGDELNDLKSKCVYGFIKIQDSNSIILNQDGNKYVKFKYDSSVSTKFKEQLTLVPKFMRKVWSMKSPHIIIPIITGVTNFKNWKNQKLEEQFRRGLMKVIMLKANTT